MNNEENLGEVEVSSGVNRYPIPSRSISIYVRGNLHAMANVEAFPL
jgi:hypothetical protein